MNARASTPSARAAIGDPCSARSARPAGLSTRLPASTIAATRIAANTQYHAARPTARRPKIEKSGTDMPSGPPVSAVLVGQRDRDDDAEPERRHGEIVALEAQDRRAPDDRRSAPTPAALASSAAHRRPAVCADEDRRAVGAQAEERRMAEADLAGVADQQIERDRQRRVDRDADRDVELIGVGQNERQRRRESRRRSRPAQERARAARGDLSTRSDPGADAAPNSPRGRTNSTTSTITKAAASL